MAQASDPWSYGSDPWTSCSDQPTLPQTPQQPDLTPSASDAAAAGAGIDLWKNYRMPQRLQPARDQLLPTPLQQEMPAKPALMTIRGAVIVIHDRQLALELMLPVRDALAANVAVASPAGLGWRSKLVQKKLLREAKPQGAAADGGGPSLPARSEDEVQAEVQSRFAAVAPALLAQVLASSAAGVNIRSTAGLIPADEHVRASVAKHNFLCGKAFSDLSVADVRREQRQFRRDASAVQTVSLAGGKENVAEDMPQPEAQLANATVYTTEKDQHTTVKGQLATEKNELTTEKGQHTTEKGQHTTEKGQLTTENGQYTTEKDQHTTVKGQLTTEKGQLTTERDQLTTEKGQQTSVKGQLTTDKDQLTTENGQFTAEMGQRVTEQDTSAASSQVSLVRELRREFRAMLAQSSADLAGSLAVLGQPAGG